MDSTNFSSLVILVWCKNISFTIDLTNLLTDNDWSFTLDGFPFTMLKKKALGLGLGPVVKTNPFLKVIDCFVASKFSTVYSGCSNNNVNICTIH